VIPILNVRTLLHASVHGSVATSIAEVKAGAGHVGVTAVALEEPLQVLQQLLPQLVQFQQPLLEVIKSLVIQEHTLFLFK
jgi:hypothetical protein